MRKQRNVDKPSLDKGNKRGNERKRKQKQKQKAAAVLLAVLFLLCGAGRWYRQWQADHTGMPDAVSSRMENRECFLDVIANADRIEDTEGFARNVIQMCRENSFRSIRLSTDLYGYPERLEINVYLHREEVNKEEPVMRIRYEPAEDPVEGEGGEKYNIKDHAEKYKLYVDGKEIPCYYY